MCIPNLANLHLTLAKIETCKFQSDVHHPKPTAPHNDPPTEYPQVVNFQKSRQKVGYEKDLFPNALRRIAHMDTFGGGDDRTTRCDTNLSTESLNLYRLFQYGWVGISA